LSAFEPKTTQSPFRLRLTFVVDWSAGVAAPVAVDFMVPNNPESRQAAEVLQAMAAEAGFDLKIRVTEFATSLNHEDAGQFQLFSIGWSGRIDPDGNFYQFVNSKGSQNDSGYVNAVVDRATNSARKAASQQARIVDYHAALVQVLKDLPLIYLYHPINRFGVSKTVGGVHVYGDGLIRAQFAGFKQGT